MSEGPRSPTCPYCGASVKSGGECARCADLPELERELRHDHRPLSETELGVRPPHRVPKRAGRSELY